MEATKETPFLYRPENKQRLIAARRALTVYGLSDYGPELEDIADSVLVEVDEIDLGEPYPEDRATEIGDSAVPVYTGDIVRAVAESLTLITSEPEVGPAFDGAPTLVNIAGGILYDMATGIAHQRLQERQQDA